MVKREMLGEFIQEKEVLSMAKKDWPEYINICIIYRIVTLFFRQWFMSLCQFFTKIRPVISLL